MHLQSSQHNFYVAYANHEGWGIVSPVLETRVQVGQWLKDAMKICANATSGIAIFDRREDAEDYRKYGMAM